MNTKMKVLALALLGLAGYAGSAVAGGCPDSPVPPWTAVNALGGSAAIADGGYAGTSCRLDSSLTGDASSFATVQDDTPNAEPRYRAGFIVNADSLVNLGLVDAVFVFSATSTSSPNPPVQLSVVGDGAGGHLISYIVANGATVLSGSVPLAAGENQVQFDYDTTSSATGPRFAIWVNGTDENTPSFTSPITNTGTVDTAFLGLAGATPTYLSAFNGTAVGFDQFDSRRQTFITF
jgi:hypothetical protein